MEYYVDQKAVPSGNGSKEAPFQRISQAAYVAAPGDVIYVLPGIYREWVDPQNGGTPDQRITYISKEPLKAVITGGERSAPYRFDIPVLCLRSFRLLVLVRSLRSFQKLRDIQKFCNA